MNELKAHITLNNKDGEKVVTMNFPSKFEEFTRHHLFALAEWLGDAKDPVAFPRFVVKFMKMPKRIWRHLDADELFYCEVDEKNEVTLMPELQFLSKRYENLASLLPRVGLLYGPTNRMNNLTLENVAFADMFSSMYAEAETLQNLNLFFGSIYRPLGIPFRKKLIPMFAFFARFATRRIKEAAMLNYRGIHSAYKQLFPEVYRSKGSRSATARLGWPATIRSLAKTGIHGTERECRRVKFIEAMLTFELNNIEVREMDDRMKKARKK